MAEPLILPTGYGFRRVTVEEIHASIFDTLVIWEPPRRRGTHRYVMGVDVSDGLGMDRSVIEVVRCGTLDEPAEQVAEYISDQMLPVGLAYVIQTIGQYYRDRDGVEALAAIECNNHGLATQDTLQLHLGYGNFYVWEYYDSADPGRRFSTKIGWLTTVRTRPLLLSKLHAALTTIDPITSAPDFVTHSPVLHAELKDFQTESTLAEAAASRGAHDDCVMAAAIGYYCAYREQSGESEPLEERRRLRSEQQAVMAAANAQSVTPDWRNTPTTVDEASHWVEETPEHVDEQMYDPRRHDDSAW